MYAGPLPTFPPLFPHLCSETSGPSGGTASATSLGGAIAVPTEEADAEKMAALRQARCLCPTWCYYHTRIPRDVEPGPLLPTSQWPQSSTGDRMFTRTRALAFLTIPLTHPPSLAPCRPPSPACLGSSLHGSSAIMPREMMGLASSNPCWLPACPPSMAAPLHLHSTGQQST